MKYLVFIFAAVLLLGCSKDSVNHESSQSNNPSVNGNEGVTYSLSLDYSEEFPVGHDLGINYFNDITIGVLDNETNNVRIITAAGTRSYLLKGTSLSNLTEAVQIASPAANTFYSDYIGLGQIIKDKEGTIYSVFHAEQHDGSLLPGNVPGFYASVGLATSKDNGQTFDIKPTALVQNIYDFDYDNGYGDGGLGEPSITFSKDSTEVFLYYVDHNRTGRGVNICMAKFNVSSKGVPDFDTIFYLGQYGNWRNYLIRSEEVVAGIGYSDAILPHVTYNRFTDTYLMVYSLNDYGEYHEGAISPSTSGIYIRQSKDGINWTSAPQQLITGWSIPYSYDKHSFIWHPNLIYGNKEQSEGYLVYSRANTLKEGHKMWAIKFYLTED